MDTLGLLVVVVLTVASADDGTIAPEVLGQNLQIESSEKADSAKIAL